MNTLEVVATLGGSLLIARHGVMRAQSISARVYYKDEYRSMCAVVLRAKKRKLLRAQKRSGQIEVALTDTGLIHGLKIAMTNDSRLLPQGERCLVTFDVPEHVRHIRKQVRKLLRDLEFEQLQQSVWQSRRDLVDLMNIYLKRTKLNEWVCVFHVLR